jgi:hypothetical protein
MKKLIATVVLAMMPALFFAQGTFAKFEKDAEVTSLVIGKKAFSLMASAKFAKNEKTAPIVEMVADIESVSVYTTKAPSSAAEMKSTTKTYLKKKNFEPLIEVKDKGKLVTISVRDEKKSEKIKEILVFVDGMPTDDETIIISIVGNFDLEKLSEIMQSKEEPKVDAKMEQVASDFIIKVQPNPVSDAFYLNTDEPAQVTLYDLSGRVVKKETYSPAGISVVGLKPETYIAEIIIGDRKQTQKIIVK